MGGNNLPNPAMMILQAIASGRPLDNILDAIGKQSPEMDKAVSIIRGKNAEQLQGIAENMARERGIDIRALVKNLGINM